MSDVAIRVENLSKLYRRGLPTGNDRLSEVISSTAQILMKLPFRLIEQFRPQPISDSPTRYDAGEFWALKSVSFEVMRGEVVGIIGRNGAGKSTLLKVLSRITLPTSGRFGLAGRVACLLEVGTGFHGELTGRENIFLSGSLLGMRRAEVRKQFDEIVAFAEVDEFLDTPVKRYSSGMQTRLGFAVAAHLNTDILIVDEVLAVGDAEFQKRCLGKMHHMAADGRTVLFVSHNSTSVTSLCSRALWLDGGQIRADDTAGEAVRRYACEIPAGAATRDWGETQAPRGGGVSLRHFSALPVDSATLRPLTLDDPVAVRIVIRVDAGGPMLTFSLRVCTADGTTAFITNTPAMAVRPGEVTATLTIPGSLLNAGVYRLTLVVVSEESYPLITVVDAVEFSVAELERNSTWHGYWDGVVRPRLPWRVEQHPCPIVDRL